MAISNQEDHNNMNPYNKIEQIVMERLFSLEEENTKLRNELTYVKAKLEVYERIANISDTKKSLGFGPPIREEGGNE